MAKGAAKGPATGTSGIHCPPRAPSRAPLSATSGKPSPDPLAQAKATRKTATAYKIISILNSFSLYITNEEVMEKTKKVSVLVNH